MKIHANLPFAIKVMALVLTLSLSACDNPFFEDGDWGNKPDKNKPSATCTISGTMVRVQCGVSIYDGLWIRTKEGKLLQPCSQSFQTLCPIVLAEGDEVKFSYRTQKGTSSCDSMITCMVALPPHQSVIIDCITRVGPVAPSLQIDEQAQHDNSVQVLDAQLSGNIIKLKVGYSGCAVKPASQFKLLWNGSFKESNPVQVDLFLNDMKPEACQAYFTQELEFDISILKASGVRPLKINLQQFSVTYP